MESIRHQEDVRLCTILEKFSFSRIAEELEENEKRSMINNVWDLLSIAYYRWREMMPADFGDNGGPFVPKIFPPENTVFVDSCLFVANWLKKHIELSADSAVQNAYQPLTRLQLICQYARFSSLSLLMFCDHDHGIYRTKLIEGVEYLCQLCLDLHGPGDVLSGIFGAAMSQRTNETAPQSRVQIPEIYGYLKHFQVAMLAAAAVLSHYCPLPYDASQAMVSVVLTHADKIYEMIRRSLEDVDFNIEFRDQTMRQIAMTDRQVDRCPLSDFLDLAAQKLDVVSACAARQDNWRHYWHEESPGGYVPFDYELRVAIEFLKFRLRRNARLALGVYGSNEVGGMENALRDENIEYKVVRLNDFADGVLLVFQAVKHQAVDDKWKELDPSHGVLSTDVTIVFRGSQGLSADDWKLNLLGIPFTGTIEYKGRVLLRRRMHLGFYYRAKYLVPRILNEIEHYLDLRGRQFVNRIVHRLTHKLTISICGHSQGASEATLLSHCIATYFSPSEQVRGAILSFPTMSRTEVETMTTSVHRTLAKYHVNADKCGRIYQALTSFSDSVIRHIETQALASYPNEVATPGRPKSRLLPGMDNLVSLCQWNEKLARCATGIGARLGDLRRDALYAFEDDLNASNEESATSAEIRGALEEIFHASLTKWMMPVAMLGRPVAVTTFANPGVFCETDNLGETAIIRHVTYAVDKDFVPRAGRCFGFRHFANVENKFAFRSVVRDAAADTFMTPHLPKTYEWFVLRIAAASDPYSVVWAAHNVVIEPNMPPMPPDNTCQCLKPLQWLTAVVLAPIVVVVVLVVMLMYAAFVVTRISLPHVVPTLLRGGLSCIAALGSVVALCTATSTSQQAVIPVAPVASTTLSNPAHSPPSLVPPSTRDPCLDPTNHLNLQLPAVIEESVYCESSTGLISNKSFHSPAHGQSLSPMDRAYTVELTATDAPQVPQ